MKPTFYFCIAILLLMLIAGSCRRDKKDNNTTVTTLANVDSVFKDISEHQKSNFDLAPIVLPSYITQSTDTMKKKIIDLANLINSFRAKSVHMPSVTLKALTQNYKNRISPHNPAQSESSQEGIIEECHQFQVQNMTLTECTYTWYENNGKLKIVLTRGQTPTTWTLDVEYNGVDSDGQSYDHFILYSEIMNKDLTYNQITWFSQIFELYPPCGAGPLWTFLTKVENGGTLYFMGEEIPLTTFIYIVMRYDCGFLDDHNQTLAWMQEIKTPPDGSVIMLQYDYSYRLHGLYLSGEYDCFPDGSWDATVYDDYGNVTDHKQWPIE